MDGNLAKTIELMENHPLRQKKGIEDFFIS